MSTFSRRRFLEFAALSGVAGLAERLGAIPRDARAAADHSQGAGHGTAAQTVPGGAARNKLLLPGDRGVLGILDATAPLAITARTIEHAVLPGKATPLWVYEVAHQGRIYINPIFRVRAGGEFRATLDNRLREDTIIHWHGLHVDERNDTHPRYAVKSGGRYDYAFKVADRAATYWYHPHPHGLTSRQAYMGLASLFLVEDDEERALQKALDLRLGVSDIPLVIQDKRFDARGMLVYAPADDEWFGGFVGETVLANLTPQPYFDAATRVYRFRLLNGSNARLYRLSFVQAGKALDFHLIGSDGGLLERAYRVKEAFLSPGERADVLLDLSKAQVGSSVLLKSLAFDPMHLEAAGGGHAGHAMPMQGPMEGMEMDILTINVRTAVRFERKIPGRLSRLPALKASGAKDRVFTLEEKNMQWRINGLAFDMRATPVTVNRNTVEVWEIRNARQSMPHPMHVHGFQFRVLERRGSPEQQRGLALDAQGRCASDTGWKDTVLVWPGETVRIGIDFTHKFSGDQIYLFHCHNLEHEDRGMMLNYRVKA